MSRLRSGKAAGQVWKSGRIHRMTAEWTDRSSPAGTAEGVSTHGPRRPHHLARLLDLRFPTSRQLDGSDAMNPDPDYSAAYVVLRTDRRTRRGARVRVHHRPGQRRRRRRDRRAARRSCVGRDARRVLDRPRRASAATLVGDSQLRWLGPEKGVMHMAIGAVRQRGLGPGRQARGQAGVEAARRPDARSSSSTLVDFRYLSDALTPRRGAGPAAVAEAGARASGRRILLRDGLSGLHDLAGMARVRRRRRSTRLARQAIADGLHADQAQGRRHAAGRHPPVPGGAREAVGPDVRDRGRREPALGRGRGDRLDRRARPSSTPTGSRSRPARTTCSATRRSAARSRR